MELAATLDVGALTPWLPICAHSPVLRSVGCVIPTAERLVSRRRCAECAHVLCHCRVRVRGHRPRIVCRERVARTCSLSLGVWIRHAVGCGMWRSSLDVSQTMQCVATERKCVIAVADDLLWLFCRCLCCLRFQYANHQRHEHSTGTHSVFGGSSNVLF